MTTTQLQEFARLGAEARLETIRDERQAILGVFPELRDGADPARRASSAASSPARGRRRMSAAERKAVGRRMRAYWAKRRAKRSGTAKKAARTTKRKGGMSAENRKRQGERMRAYWAAKRGAKVDGTGAGTPSKTASQNGAGSTKRGGKTARKRGRNKEY